MNNMAVMNNEQNNEQNSVKSQFLQGVSTWLNALVKEFVSNYTTIETDGEQVILARIRFNKKECKQMDKEFAKLFVELGGVASIKKYLDKERKIMYTISFRRGGYKIVVSSADIKQAKRKFIEETRLKSIKIGA